MTLFKHTEPPKEDGTYVCIFKSGAMAGIDFNVKDGFIDDNGETLNQYIVAHYSPSPPKEIEEILTDIADQLLNGQKQITLQREDCETLLKLRAE